MATVKVNELVFKKWSAAEVLRFSVEELKTELHVRAISFNTRDRKRDLQVKLCEALSIVIDPSNLATDVVTVSEMDRTKVGDGDVSSHNSRENSPARSVRSNYSKSEFSSNLTQEQLFQLESKKLEIDRQIELTRLQAEIDLNRRRLDYQHTVDMAQAQSRPTGSSGFNVPSVHTSSQDISKQRIDVMVKLVPRFDPTDVHLFFTSFERAVEINKIQRAHWPALLHAVATGKALRVLSAMSLSDAQDYDVVKETLLVAFDVCAEIFRKRFRNITKNSNETFAEYSFKIKESFDRWLFKSEVKDFNSLQQLILLERFNESFVDDADLAMWMLNKTPLTLSEAARLADEFSSLRRANRVSKKHVNNTAFSDCKPSSERNHFDRESGSVPAKLNSSNPVIKTWKNNGSSERALPAATYYCGYCKKPGHSIATCYKLKNKNESTSPRDSRESNTPFGDRSVNFVSTRNNLNELQADRKERVDVRFRPHCFEATIIRPDKTEFQVMCLRDTAALQSLIRDFHSNTENEESLPPYLVTHDIRQICGIGGLRIAVPLVQVEMRSEKLTGSYELGVCNTLPEGVDLLAGNDLFSIQEVCVITRSQTALQRTVEDNIRVDDFDVCNDEIIV